MIFIIGAGGVGSWLAPSLCMLVGPHRITVVDGDKLEKKNLNRQLFTPDDIGRNKAEALADKYHCQACPEWFSEGKFGLQPSDILIGCVDNHRARLEILSEADINGCKSFLAANETYSAEAFVYRTSWRGTPNDPRVYYPEILSDRAGDPRAHAIGCTGEAQAETPQLVSANFMAAALVQHLFVLWTIVVCHLNPDGVRALPTRLVCNMTSMSMAKVA